MTKQTTYRFVVTGTDTDVGKTVFAAALTRALGASYWKPVQSGLEGETDSQVVARLAELSSDLILPEAWRLKRPLSPHLAADKDGVAIDPERLNPPEALSSLVIEGAGGLLVPLSYETTFADVFARWKIPVIVCARTRLGTINHSLLTLQTLRSYQIPIAGIVFIGDPNPDSERTIVRMADVLCLGRLPWLDPLTPQSLSTAFEKYCDLELIKRQA